MMHYKPITIVGGGVAGLTLGVGLRQLGVPVVLWEAGRYPRHRVCGEFISGSGQETLEHMGLIPGLQALGARRAHTASFYAGNRRIAMEPLKQPAWCISRFRMDDWLAKEFQRLGGDLRSGVRWSGEWAPGTVCATGRRVTPQTKGWRIFGLKVHAQGLEMSSDLEMHFVPSGYVGLCRLSGGVVNLCGLFRSATTVPNLARQWPEWLRGQPGSALHQRLEACTLDHDSFCSMAGVSLGSPEGRIASGCCIGDALSMIPPVTGNGMSMALEAAESALDPLRSYSLGSITWSAAQAEIASLCQRRFSSRLRWARALHWLAFHPTALFWVCGLAGRFQGPLRFLLNRVR